MKSPLWVTQAKKIEEKEYEGKCLLFVTCPAFASFMQNYEILFFFVPWHRICAWTSSSWERFGVLG